MCDLLSLDFWITKSENECIEETLSTTAHHVVSGKYPNVTSFQNHFEPPTDLDSAARPI